MKYAIAAVAVVAAIAGGAIAQTTETPGATPPAATTPAVPTPPSACPAYPSPPTLPEVAALRNQKAVNAGTETVNAWITQYQTVGACRRDEVTKLDAQLQARVAEFKDGNARAMQVRDQWQTTVDAVVAQGQKKKR
ncbi:MAG: hypothetical protein IV086_07150 [Hyphomonadaceae bacterium]|nr:MAG: hypothetical protein FD160_3641 [Caulobacteraceae bacterium]MBT9445457.1 hypothetical protein [Hyphomonadaceae bacterium]TPW03328.1 MAG: hypothetical protein FD124_3061 [Alphaproteobacteria bacterium]